MTLVFNPFTATLDFVGSTNVTLSTANIKAQVSPTESPDGTRTTFTVPETYIAGTLNVFLNGINEANITEASTTTFTFSTAPLTGDQIKLNYAIEVV